MKNQVSVGVSENKFSLIGDLCQMYEQRSFLRGHKIVVFKRNKLQQLDVEKALKLIWENKVQGWWLYEDQYLKHGICSQQQLTEALRVENIKGQLKKLKKQANEKSETCTTEEAIQKVFDAFSGWQPNPEFYQEFIDEANELKASCLLIIYRKKLELNNN